MSAPTKEHAVRVIELAGRAPSVHNTQPWRWRVVDGATIELYADRGRQLPISDASGRNLALSCGAALHHSIVAAEALGLTPSVELLPSAEDQDLLARVTLGPGTKTDAALEALQALEDRNTDRRRFTSWPIPESRLDHLAAVASGWGAHAIPITDVLLRFRTEDLINKAMAVQATNPSIVAEQREWMGFDSRDGMPLANVVPPTRGQPPLHANRYATPAETAESAGAARVVDSSDGLVAICSAFDDLRSWLQAGEALSALWLRATAEGLSVVPLSQVVEVEETRHALHHTVFDGMARPQILLRVGWLESTRPLLGPTPRRPVDEVIES